MIKMLFSDMDGTIIDFNEMKHEHDKEMLEELKKQGHLIAFNTGRNFQEAYYCIDRHHFPYDYLILNNGAHIVNKEGKVLGKHKGQIHYTIGQRRGLGISAPESLYVCGKSLDSNEVILGGKQDLMSNYCYINDINLIPWDHLDAPIKCKVKTRYRQPEQPATVEQIGEDLIKITFDEPQRAVTPGQAAVLYDDDMVLGGGTILPEGLASTMTTSQGTNN